MDPDLVLFEATAADVGWDQRRLAELLPRGIGWDSPLYGDVLKRSGVRPGVTSEDYAQALAPVSLGPARVGLPGRRRRLPRPGRAMPLGLDPPGRPSRGPGRSTGGSSTWPEPRGSRRSSTSPMPSTGPIRPPWRSTPATSIPMPRAMPCWHAGWQRRCGRCRRLDRSWDRL